MTTIDQFLSSWADAERTGDAEATAALLTDDFVGIGPLGFQLPKSAWLGRLASGDLQYDELSLDEPSVREYGDAAIVSVRVNTRGTARGNPLPTTRTTLTLVQVDGDWKAASIHHSFIAGTPGAPVPA